MYPDLLATLLGTSLTTAHSCMCAISRSCGRSVSALCEIMQVHFNDRSTFPGVNKHALTLSRVPGTLALGVHPLH